MNITLHPYNTRYATIRNRSLKTHLLHKGRLLNWGMLGLHFPTCCGCFVLRARIVEAEPTCSKCKVIDNQRRFPTSLLKDGDPNNYLTRVIRKIQKMLRPKGQIVRIRK